MMPEVVKQRRETNVLPPRDERFRVGKKVDVRAAVPFVREDVEHAAGELHDAEGVLEPAMRRAGIHEIRQRELMDVSEPLKRPRIDRRHFIRRNANEVVNRVSNFVLMLRHGFGAS